MKFSVLMSVYYKEKPRYLQASLESVFTQTLRADEVILVEDGRLTDELYKVIDLFKSKYPELKIIKIPENGGLGRALNEGVKYCTNEVVIRMDTDDIAKPDRFKIQIDFMASHPDTDVCSAWVEEFLGSPENVVSLRTLPETHEEIFEFGRHRCPVNHPATVYRKSSVIKSGGYGPFPEDYYLWGKMLVDGCKFYNLQTSLVKFRLSEDMYRRRGGWRYSRQIHAMQWYLHKIGYISFPLYLKNSFIRTIVSLLPCKLRAKLYEQKLRTKKQ